MTELNNKMLVKVGLLLFLMGISATVEAGRLNPSFIISQLLNNGDASYLPKASTKDCCEKCVAVVNYPDYWWQCKDVAESCPAACKSCVCTKSNPPQCQCMETATGNCYIPAC